MTGGLGEAASWIVLRQDIYWSLTHAQPLCIDLDFYERSSSFLEETGEALANKSVYLCAQVLANSFEMTEQRDFDRWTELNESVKRWPELQPPDLRPLWLDLTGGSGSALPAVWTIHPTHGTQ